jgi:hypothetical protein
MSDQVSGGVPAGKRYFIQHSLMETPEALWLIHSGL